MPCDSLKISYAEPLPQRLGPHRFDILRPQLFQAPSCIVPHDGFCFTVRMKTEQQPFEIWPEKNELQVLATLDRIRIAASGAILCQPVRIEKNQRRLVVPS